MHHRKSYCKNIRWLPRNCLTRLWLLTQLFQFMMQSPFIFAFLGMGASLLVARDLQLAMRLNINRNLRRLPLSDALRQNMARKIHIVISSGLTREY